MKDGTFGFRAVVPKAYPIPGDVSSSTYVFLFVVGADCESKGPVGELLISQSRHNMRPNHLHMVVEAPGYHKLVTALYPEGCDYLGSDPVFGVKKSLVVVCSDSCRGGEFALTLLHRTEIGTSGR